MANWRTGIAEVVSTESEEEILVRGRKLSELIGSVSFAEMMFLLLTGREATKPQARVLDALLVASIEHGIAPPSMIARCYASYGTSIQAAMAGGIMAFGDTMGGAGEQLAKLLSEAVSSIDGEPDDNDLQRLAAEIVVREGRVPGYGTPLHGADPSAPKMLSVAARSPTSSPSRTAARSRTTIRSATRASSCRSPSRPTGDTSSRPASRSTNIPTPASPSSMDRAASRATTRRES